MKLSLEYHNLLRQWRAQGAMLCITLTDNGEVFGKILSSSVGNIIILSPSGERRVYGLGEIDSIELLDDHTTHTSAEALELAEI